MKEVNKRIAETYVTWKKLEEFWKHSNCSTKFKITVHDAMVRTKLMYGLESLQLNDSIINKIEIFQRKGIRQILKMKTTFGQMETGGDRKQVTDEEMWKQANKKHIEGKRGKKGNN